MFIFLHNYQPALDSDKAALEADYTFDEFLKCYVKSIDGIFFQLHPKAKRVLKLCVDRRTPADSAQFFNETQRIFDSIEYLKEGTLGFQQRKSLLRYWTSDSRHKAKLNF